MKMKLIVLFSAGCMVVSLVFQHGEQMCFPGVVTWKIHLALTSKTPPSHFFVMAM